MNKTIIVLLSILALFVIGCQPPGAQPATPATEPGTPAAPSAPAAEPTVAPAEVPPAPLENVPAMAVEGIDIEQACYGLLPEGEFESVCGYAGKVVLSHKISEGGCWVNIADHRNNKLTAGFTVVDWKKSDESNDEFDRGVRARVRQGAVEGKEVGERTYHYQELDRENIVWVNGAFLTKLGSMHELCPPEKLVEVAKKIASRLT